MRPRPQDLLHQRLVEAEVGQGREQAGEARRLDSERPELRSPLPPDLEDGADAGFRKRVRRRLRRGGSDEGGDHLTVGDVVGSEQRGGELTGADRHGAPAIGLRVEQESRRAPSRRCEQRLDGGSDRPGAQPFAVTLLARARGK